MNTDNMRKLADALDARAFPPGVGFNLSYYFYNPTDTLEAHNVQAHAAPDHACGSVACIAGMRWSSFTDPSHWSRGPTPKSGFARWEERGEDYILQVFELTERTP